MTGIVMITKILIMMLTNDHALCMMGIMVLMMLTMLFATVCEVVEAVESKCALVPPTITNLYGNN